MPEHFSAQSAGRYAESYLQEYLDRQSGRYQQHSFDDDIDIEIPLSWRTEIEQHTSKTIKILFRYVYAQGRPLSVVSKQKLVPHDRLNRAQIELRRMIKTRAQVDGLDTRGWSDSRIDRLLARTAQLPNPDYIEPEALLSTASKKQVMSCPVYRQAYSLIQQGVLSIDDLIPQPFGAEEDTEILAVVLHPEGRKFQNQVHKAMGNSAISTTQHEWLIDGDPCTLSSTILEHWPNLIRRLDTFKRCTDQQCQMGTQMLGTVALSGPKPLEVRPGVFLKVWTSCRITASTQRTALVVWNCSRCRTVCVLWLALTASQETICIPFGWIEVHEGQVYVRFDVHDQAQLALIVLMASV